MTETPMGINQNWPMFTFRIAIKMFNLVLPIPTGTFLAAGIRYHSCQFNALCCSLTSNICHQQITAKHLF